jgi:1D-myo-inositol 3-kinase
VVSNQETTPDFLVIGHVTQDVDPDAPAGYVIGGTASYASLAVRNLGRRVAVLTRCAALPELPDYLSGVALRCLPADVTTTFENRYTARGREQYVRAAAPAIPADAIPESWRTVPVAHLGPVAQEVPAELAEGFAPTTLLGATPQGWLRAWGEDGRVRPAPWREAERILAGVDVLVFSLEDMRGDRDLVRRYAEMARLAVVTENRRGCVVWQGGRQERFPAFVANEVDPTGAGDVFAAAFLLRYAETRDRAVAARYANCVASFAVEGHGTSSLPTAEQVERRLATGKHLA